jgi:hypothetical protein
MTNLLATGVDWMLTQLGGAASSEYTYRRGAVSVTLSMTKGKTDYVAQDDAGNTVAEVTDATFIVRSSLLVFNEEIVEPKSGDIIEGTEGDYEVMQRGPALPPYTKDASGQLLRIHAKLIRSSNG